MRIDKAVCDLWDGWVDSKGSMNNFRVFSRGNMVKPDQVHANDILSWISH
jgi:hypothetical protein